MGLALYQVDAFTDKPFAGNPAGVCILEAPQPETWMLSVAREMNLSETAFLLPENDGYRLRWFTPAAEVELCGHATLASAHILFQIGLLRPEQTVHFYTLSGLLTARQEDGWVLLNFPSNPPLPASPPGGLIEALGVKALFVGKDRFDYLVEVETEEDVRQLKPDIQLLKTVPARGIIVTARAAGSGYDFISRFFAPQVGVDEDPVTGSAHCSLAPFWSVRLGKNEFLAYQASARGGVLRVQLKGDRVTLAGQAVTVFTANLF